MEDICTVADLRSLSSSDTPDILQKVSNAVRSLESRRIVPATGVSTDCLRATREALRRAATDSEPPPSDQELFRRLWRASRAQPELRPYLDTVTRLWLIFPSGRVIQDMAATIREVLRSPRRLSHKTVDEALVRWNGPDLSDADALIQAAQRKYDSASPAKATSQAPGR